MQSCLDANSTTGQGNIKTKVVDADKEGGYRKDITGARAQTFKTRTIPDQ